MSLPRERRITRTADFAAVRERGRSWGGRYLVLCTLPREATALAGFTVSKRVGNAVVRNRVRRRLREIAREFLPLVTAPHWIVTIARHTAPGAEFSALRDEWHRLARRAGLVPDHRLPRPAAAES